VAFLRASRQMPRWHNASFHTPVIQSSDAISCDLQTMSLSKLQINADTLCTMTRELGELSRYSDGLQAGRSYFDSRLGQIFLFSIASSPALTPTHSPTQWVPGALPLGVKRRGIEADHSPPWRRYLHSRLRLHGVRLN
jgi:hypothetical protein